MQRTDDPCWMMNDAGSFYGRQQPPPPPPPLPPQSQMMGGPMMTGGFDQLFNVGRPDMYGLEMPVGGHASGMAPPSTPPPPPPAGAAAMSPAGIQDVFGCNYMYFQPQQQAITMSDWRDTYGLGSMLADDEMYFGRGGDGSGGGGGGSGCCDTGNQSDFGFMALPEEQQQQQQQQLQQQQEEWGPGAFYSDDRQQLASLAAGECYGQAGLMSRLLPDI